MPELAHDGGSARRSKDRGAACAGASAADFSSGTLEWFRKATVPATVRVSSAGHSAGASATNRTQEVADTSAFPTPAHGDPSVHHRLNCVHLGTALVTRNESILIVASRYPNHTEALWHLPGGRQQPGELLTQTVVRELYEETQLSVAVDELLYVSESYDPITETHFTNHTFSVTAAGEPAIPPTDAHVVAFKWVPPQDLAGHIRVAVVREPLLAFFSGKRSRYFGYASAGISIEFAD